MSDRDDDFQLDDERQAAAASDWDENGAPGEKAIDRNAILGSHYIEDMPDGSAAVDLVGAVGELVGARIQMSPRVGPIQFEGREDYIRGDGDTYVRGETACLRGCDLVGLVPQLGSRRGYDLLGAGPLSFNTAMNRTTTGPKMSAGTTTRQALRNVSENPSLAQGLRQFQLAKSPLKSRPYTAAVRPRSAIRPTVATTLKNAKASAARAVSIANTVDARVAAAAKKGIHGDDGGYDLLGAVRRAAMRTAGPKVSPSQAKKLAGNLRANAKRTLEAATKLEVTAAQRAAAIKAGKGKAGKTVSAPTGVRGIIGDDPFDDTQGGASYDDIIGEGLLEVVGDSAEILGGRWLPSSPQPGDTPGAVYFEWEGPPAEPDVPMPGDTGGTGGTTPGAPGTPPSYSDGRYPGPDTNYGLPQKPTKADATAAFMSPAEYESGPTGTDQEKMLYVYTSRPRGSIWYDYSRAPGDKDLGSYSYYTGYGSDGQPAEGGIWSEPPLQRPGVWWHQDGWWSHWPAASRSGDAIQNLNMSTAEAQAHADTKKWGPLVGNPGGFLKDLRYDRSNPQESAGWFWHRDQAPQWAKDPEINVLWTQMLTDWQSDMDDAMANYLEQSTKDFNDAKTDNELARKRFLEDAETARQNDATAQANARADAETERQRVNTEAALAQQQAATDEANYQRESQLDQQYAQQQMQMEQQQGQLMFQQQQAEQQAYQNWLNSPAAQQGGGYDGGYGGGYEDQGGYGGPFEDLYEGGGGGDEFGGSYWKDDKSENELTARSSQRPEFDGDWS